MINIKFLVCMKYILKQLIAITRNLRSRTNFVQDKRSLLHFMSNTSFSYNIIIESILLVFIVNDVRIVSHFQIKIFIFNV
jgi:hypothetical protein